MHNAIRQADRVLAVLSPDYLESAYATEEWTAVWAPSGRSDRLLPVRVIACEPTGLLASRSYIDLVGLDESTARDRLLEGVRQGIQPSAEAPFPPGHGPGPGVARRFPGDLPAIWNVPHPQHPYFVGRDGTLALLRTGLPEPTGTKPPQVIVGMAGVGKTQLMVEYAHQERARFDLIWWLRADERTTLVADYADLATKLGIEEQPSQEATAALVRDRLRHEQCWLLLFDNVPGPEVVADLLPVDGFGQVLLTSRWSSNWTPRAARVELDLLSQRMPPGCSWP
jgi:TIR domain